MPFLTCVSLQDCLHGDIDYYDRRLIFTIDPINYAGLPEYVQEIRTEGTRFITILVCINIIEQHFQEVWFPGNKASKQVVPSILFSPTCCGCISN